MMLLSRTCGLAALCVVIAVAVSCSSPANQKVVRNYNLGERVQVGPLIYTVFETKWLTQIGNVVGTARVPTNRFFLVRINIVNSGSQEASAPPLSITDDSGQTLAELSNGEGIPQWAGYLRSIKPANSLQGYIVFDAPPRHYKLNLNEELDENKVMVDIPLNFVQEAPEISLPIPAPGQPAVPPVR